MSQTESQGKSLPQNRLRSFYTALIISTAYIVSQNADAQTAQDCQDISNPQERLSCYDNLFAAPDLKIVPSTSPKSEEAAPAEIPSPKPAPLPKSAPVPSVESFGERGKNDELTRPVAPKPTAKKSVKLAPKEITSLTQQVAKIDIFGYKKLRITLENGQVWEQIGSVSHRPPKMSSKRPLIAEIKKAALNSFSLQFNGKGRAIKVKRVR